MNKEFLKIFFCTLSLVVPELLFARDGAGANNKTFYLGLGAVARNAGKTATVASSGKKPLFAEVYTNLNFSMIFDLGAEWSLSPNFFFGVPSKKTPEKKSTTNVYGYGVRVLYGLSGPFDFYFGPSVFSYRIKGSGGSVQLNNGASTSLFGIPSSSKTSNLVCLNLGFGYLFADTARVELSAFVSGIASSTKRAVHPALSLSMGL